MGNNLTVVNKYQNDQKFTVKVEGNVRIKNFKGNRKMQNHETMTVAKNGQVSTYYKWSNAKVKLQCKYKCICRQFQGVRPPCYHSDRTVPTAGSHDIGRTENI